MIGLVTPGCCPTQASATWPGVALRSCARAWTTSSTLKAASVKCAILPFRVLSQAAPRRRPLASVVFSAQKAAGQRRSVDAQPQAIGLSHGDRLPLNPAIQEVIRWLLAHHPPAARALSTPTALPSVARLRRCWCRGSAPCPLRTRSSRARRVSSMGIVDMGRWSS